MNFIRIFLNLFRRYAISTPLTAKQERELREEIRRQLADLPRPTYKDQSEQPEE